uniref:Uncharacterized protein n=1 Tax=Riptortus pedestris TaxID=329032 RepID=R4WDR8_RIPPE|nr:conserved hypothetical protein [Riptortus pedestris]
MECVKPDSFNLISWEIDTTGRLLCDEIFRISMLFNNYKFDVFIMPHRDISLFSARRYQVCTSTSGLYRFLCKRPSGKILRSKTEYFGLEDFLNWLEKYSQKPIVLMFYEPYEFSPYILLQALERYGMLKRFKELVHGFAHVYAFVKKKCKKSMSSLAIRPLTKVLLNKNDVKCYDSYNRSKLIYEILLHLCDGDSANPAEVLNTELKPYIKSVDEIEKELISRKNRIDLQISLKPIFSPYLKLGDSRRKVLMLRSYLTRENVDYNVLKSLWEKGKDAFKGELLEMLKSAGEEAKKEIIAILVYHFDCTSDTQQTSANAENSSPPVKIDELVKKLSIED